MSTLVTPLPAVAAYPVHVHVEPALDGRNRLTTAFRLVLAIPHLLLVGAPVALCASWSAGSSDGVRDGASAAGGGALGTAAVVVTLIAWVAVVATARHPEGLWKIAAFYLRWRVRAVAYTALLRDEYPPFGDGPPGTAAYPVALDLAGPPADRDRVTVAFRLVLALPHLVAVWALGLAWACTTVVAWFAILFTGRYPAALYDFAVGVLRWNTRVEAYLLLLRDEYPPFSFA